MGTYQYKPPTDLNILKDMNDISQYVVFNSGKPRIILEKKMHKNTDEYEIHVKVNIPGHSDINRLSFYHSYQDELKKYTIGFYSRKPDIPEADHQKLIDPKSRYTLDASPINNFNQYGITEIDYETDTIGLFLGVSTAPDMDKFPGFINRTGGLSEVYGNGGVNQFCKPYLPGKYRIIIDRINYLMSMFQMDSNWELYPVPILLHV